VKPSVSQSFNRKFHKKGFVAHSRKELNQCLSLVNKLKIDVMVQEILPGPPTNHCLISGYIDRDFELKALFAYRRIRQFPPQFGNSTVCESIPLAQVKEMKETLLKYLLSIGYHGIFMAEFKKDSRDEEDKLLEVNARSWWYNTFPSACGVNIILMAYFDEIGEKVRSTTEYEIGRKLIYFTEDLKLALTTARLKRFSLQKWISPLLGKKDWAIFANDDPTPFLMNVLSEVRSTMKKETIDRFLRARVTARAFA
jgi:D-aspartate ligase